MATTIGKSPTSTVTRTATSTKAQTEGNITVTGGAGRGSVTNIVLHSIPKAIGRKLGIGSKLPGSSSRKLGRR